MPTVAGESASASPKVASASSRSPLIDGVLRPDAAGDDAARDAAEDGARAEGADEHPGLELAEIEVVDVRRNERDQGAEQHGVEKHDCADDGDEAAHPDSLCRPLEPESAGAAQAPGPQKMHRAGCPFVRLPD